LGLRPVNEAMKTLFTFFLAIITFAVNAQTALVPGDKSIETKWIKEDSYYMKWSVIKDTAKYEVATILNTITVDKGQMWITSNYDVKGAKTKWLDTTIVAMPSLQPVYHGSDNIERAIVMKFGKTLTGSYRDKFRKTTTPITDNVNNAAFFDSNFLPQLIRLLPFTDGYKKDIVTYDYSVANKGLITASVINVRSGSLQGKKGKMSVWVVTVNEMIKGLANTVTYYIDKTDRKIWMMEVDAQYQKMLLERIEF
jgi:hypothetical protein